MTFHWPYYDLRDGRLYNERGRIAFPKAPKFASAEEAEAWLVANDLRGNVR